MTHGFKTTQLARCLERGQATGLQHMQAFEQSSDKEGKEGDQTDSFPIQSSIRFHHSFARILPLASRLDPARH
jgi:hypothetical protein